MECTYIPLTKYQNVHAVVPKLLLDTMRAPKVQTIIPFKVKQMEESESRCHEINRGTGDFIVFLLELGKYKLINN